MPAANGTFQCVVIAPEGRLLDCKTSSVVIPAHDGQVGIWRNHMPMFCRLGLGIMEVRGVPSDSHVLPQDTFLLIDGGLALVCFNVVTIIAQDAVCLHCTERQKLEKMLEKAGTRFARGGYAFAQRTHQARKLALMTKLIQMSDAGGASSSRSKNYE